MDIVQHVLKNAVHVLVALITYKICFGGLALHVSSTEAGRNERVN
jgi:hypothetical protein